MRQLPATGTSVSKLSPPTQRILQRPRRNLVNSTYRSIAPTSSSRPTHSRASILRTLVPKLGLNPKRPRQKTANYRNHSFKYENHKPRSTISTTLMQIEVHKMCERGEKGAFDTVTTSLTSPLGRRGESDARGWMSSVPLTASLLLHTVQSGREVKR